MLIEIKGPIISDSEQWIYDWLEMPATSPGKVNKLIEKSNNEDVEIVINSGGGSVFAGSEIYTTLKSYKGNIKGKIVGLAASAASVIAAGIKDLEISPTAQIMIHRASTWGSGNSDQMQKTVDMLKGIDKSIANAYIIRTGLSQEELLDMMAKETWLDAEAAKKLGFVDKIMFQEEFKACASADTNALIPEKIISKIMEKFNDKINDKNEEQKQNKEELEKAKARIRLLNL